MKKYDYLIVGAGLFGAVFAHEARKAGRKCLVIDRRASTGGNIRCESIEASTCINTALTYSTRTRRKCGNMLHGWLR